MHDMDKSMLAFRAVPPSEWPNGDAKSIALLPELPADLPSLSFVRDRDDLDDLLLSVVETASGWRFGLISHLRSPTPGTGVYVVAHDNQLGVALREFEMALDISRDHFTWVSPLVDEA